MGISPDPTIAEYQSGNANTLPTLPNVVGNPVAAPGAQSLDANTDFSAYDLSVLGIDLNVLRNLTFTLPPFDVQINLNTYSVPGNQLGVGTGPSSVGSPLLGFVNSPTDIDSLPITAPTPSTTNTVTSNVGPSMSSDGIIVNQVYAVTGVIDTVTDSSLLLYNNPTLNQSNNTTGSQYNLGTTTGNITKVNQAWISNIADDDYNTGFQLDFTYNRTTYCNLITFKILQVPCTWALYLGTPTLNKDGSPSTLNTAPQLYTGVISAYNPPNFEIVYLDLEATYRFTPSQNLTLVLLKTPTGTQYSMGIRDFLQELVVEDNSYLYINNDFNSYSNLPDELTTASGSLYLTASGVKTITGSGTNFITLTSGITYFSTYDVNDATDLNWVNVSGSSSGSYITISGLNTLKTVSGITTISGASLFTTLTSGTITLSGTSIVSQLVTQNALGFIETYTPVTEPYNNMTISGNVAAFWKSSPQPVKDAVVFFIVDLGSQQAVNRMYLDPLYLGNHLNLYYSNTTTTVQDTSTLNWFPVNSDLTIKRGLYELPTFNTRYIKFEITQLTAEPYDLQVDSLTKQIQVFPDWVDQYFQNIEQNIPNIVSQEYNSLLTSPLYAQSIGPSTVGSPTTKTNYGLAVDQLNSSVFGTPSLNQSNENYNIVDPTISYKTLNTVADLGSTYNNITSESYIIRRFYSYGTHTYKNVIINQTWHEAYFAGINYLSFYAYAPNEPGNNREFIDYFLPTSTVSGIYTPSADTIISVSGSSATYGVTVAANTNVSGTLAQSAGWTGLGGTSIVTKPLQNFQSYTSFKFAALSSEWQTILLPAATLLQKGNLIPSSDGKFIYEPSINVTISGIPYNSNIANELNPLYGIYTISGSNGSSYIQSPVGGSQNLLTVAEANFTLGGWSGSNPVANGVTISGLSNVFIYNTNPVDGSVYGETNYSAGAFAGPSQQNQPPYTFLLTSSGLNGKAIVTTSFYTSGNNLISTMASGITVAASGTNISYTQFIPLGTSYVGFSLTASGTGSATFSNAGYFFGSSAIYSTPLNLNNMRLSAVVRIYLPDTNYGTYRCSLLTASGVEIAYKAVNNLPIQTWVDITVPYTIQQQLTNGFSAKLTQTFGNAPNSTHGETYEVAMLGVFFNPVGFQYSVDGSNWYNITTGINDANVNIALPIPTQNLWIKGLILQDNAIISAIEVVPNATQTPFYTTANITSLSNPKTNETSTSNPPILRPLFQLNSYPYPLAYDMPQLLNIANPYIL